MIQIEYMLIKRIRHFKGTCTFTIDQGHLPSYTCVCKRKMHCFGMKIINILFQIFCQHRNPTFCVFHHLQATSYRLVSVCGRNVRNKKVPPQSFVLWFEKLFRKTNSPSNDTYQFLCPLRSGCLKPAKYMYGVQTPDKRSNTLLCVGHIYYFWLF